ncbi:MAG: N-acetylmuramoyl-L-alanine amidase [Saprospiraceae bacterium]
MFKKLIDLFSNFFSSLFGGKKDKPAPTPVKGPTSGNEKSPDFAEDSSDVPVDTIVTVKVAEVNIAIPTGGNDGPFADPDKEGAFEDTPKEEPTPVPPKDKTDPTPPVDKPKPTDPTTKPPTTSKHEPRYLWCLDNGHGKLQPGKRSPLFDDGKTQFFEYEFNRDVVEKIMKALDKQGVKYFDVVPDYLEVGSFLEERVDRANKKKSDLPKIYVSVHSNAGPTADGSWVPNTIQGVETWYAQNSQKGMKIAAVFQKHIVEKTGFKDRNLKSTAISSLYVLTKTTMPAILTENGFYNNKEQVKELMKDAVRQKIADAHVDAILEIEKNGIG